MEAEFFDFYDWSIASQTAQELTLFGQPIEPSEGGPQLGAASFERDADEWTPTSWGQCRIELTAPGFGPARLRTRSRPRAGSRRHHGRSPRHRDGVHRWRSPRWPRRPGPRGGRRRGVRLDRRSRGTTNGGQRLSGGTRRSLLRGRLGRASPRQQDCLRRRRAARIGSTLAAFRVEPRIERTRRVAQRSLHRSNAEWAELRESTICCLLLGDYSGGVGEWSLTEARPDLGAGRAYLPECNASRGHNGQYASTFGREDRPLGLAPKVQFVRRGDADPRIRCSGAVPRTCCICRWRPI